MSKLQAPANAGFNAGRNYYAKPVNLDEIVIDPRISTLFNVNEKMRDEIMHKIEIEGYDKSQPVVLWKDKKILVDGHTRLSAAKALGLEEIPAVEMEFESLEDAILYTYERQVIRRNLTQEEILIAASMIEGRKERDGKGRAAEQIAERLGIGVATIFRAKKILQEAPEELIEEVKKGEKTISVAHKEITKAKTGLMQKAKTAAKERQVETQSYDSWADFERQQVYRKIMGAKYSIQASDSKKALSLLDEVIAWFESNSGNAITVMRVIA